MKKLQSARETLAAILFNEPSANYAVLAAIALIAGLIFVFTSEKPGASTHFVMLLTFLASSRLFKANLLRSFWIIAVSLFVVVLILDVAQDVG
ncbi:hypothetical protein [Hymenobacter sp. YC55]|uniref:hypothetical protein n=1 Tax=Hymenobacter sp. YC55 TaxID=3034019 RepID=UPI0023F6607A|nr:hypothetical protein [Hymenobacter sp. YC55]MDF7813917.1 hypothetical protein [Hymenobacter sp. YC55]